MATKALGNHESTKRRAIAASWVCDEHFCLGLGMAGDAVREHHCVITFVEQVATNN